MEDLKQLKVRAGLVGVTGPKSPPTQRHSVSVRDVLRRKGVHSGKHIRFPAHAIKRAYWAGFPQDEMAFRCLVLPEDLSQSGIDFWPLKEWAEPMPLKASYGAYSRERVGHLHLMWRMDPEGFEARQPPEALEAIRTFLGARQMRAAEYQQRWDINTEPCHPPTPPVGYHWKRVRVELGYTKYVLCIGRPPRYEPADFDADFHDALVLVHPSYSSKLISSRYLTNMRNAVKLAVAARRPIFYSDDDPDPRIQKILTMGSARPVPTYMGWTRGVQPRFVRKRLQREVDEIAELIGKPPAEIVLGFGGMYAEACVHAYVSYWCRDLVSVWAKSEWVDHDPSYELYRPKRPFARGDVLRALVIALN